MELKSLNARLDRLRRYSDGEFRFTGGFLGPSIRVAIVEAGTGFAAHRKATEILVKEHAPAWILAAGFSSSLADDVCAGDLSLASEIRDTHGQELELNCPIPESKHVTLRRHVCTDHHPGLPNEKHNLAREHSASAADTASMAVAQVCKASGTRCLSIRAIIDGPDEDLPQPVMDALFRPKSSDLTRNPVSRWYHELRQAREVKGWVPQATKVGRRLERFLSGVIRQLGDQIDTG